MLILLNMHDSVLSYVCIYVQPLNLLITMYAMCHVLPVGGLHTLLTSLLLVAMMLGHFGTPAQWESVFPLGCFWGVLHPPLVQIYVPPISVSEAAEPP